MPRPAIHVKDHRVGPVKNLLVCRPAIQDEVDLQPGKALQAAGQQLNTRIELVHPRRMGRLACHQYQPSSVRLLRE
jgi:hypothetical protein